MKIKCIIIFSDEKTNQIKISINKIPFDKNMNLKLKTIKKYTNENAETHARATLRTRGALTLALQADRYSV